MMTNTAIRTTYLIVTGLALDIAGIKTIPLVNIYNKIECSSSMESSIFL